MQKLSSCANLASDILLLYGSVSFSWSENDRFTQIMLLSIYASEINWPAERLNYLPLDCRSHRIKLVSTCCRKYDNESQISYWSQIEMRSSWLLSPLRLSSNTNINTKYIQNKPWELIYQVNWHIWKGGTFLPLSANSCISFINVQCSFFFLKRSLYFMNNFFPPIIS